ncbi:unannotated protein [freshwater metagenome]|uniref:Unannotated protein n=1 Tax=freshwater metagenome TaxID=449393 RepID=A0A6J7EKN9_9ZZZZ
MNQDSQEIASQSSIVEEVKTELNDIDAREVSEHSERYEALHQKLQETLSGIDGL